MSRAGSSKSTSDISQQRRPSFITKRNFASFPRLVTSIVFRNLEFKEILAVRESSSRLQHHVDDHTRRQFIKWCRNVRQSNELSHDEVLLLSVEQFTKMNFHPPYLMKLVERTNIITETCDSEWRELLSPKMIEQRDKLLKLFYEQSSDCFDERETKVIFTLTLLQMLKSLSSSKFKFVHPFNRKASLRFDFKLQDLFFAIPFYDYVYDWFSFDRDWKKMLLLLTKFLDIKVATMHNEDVKWVNFPRPMRFEDATVIFARKNQFTKRARTPAKVKCSCCIEADRDMVQAIKEFMESGEFNWENVASDFSVKCEFSCVRAKVCKFKILHIVSNDFKTISI